MFTSDSDKSIRSDFSSVTLSEDRLTTSSPPFSSLNTISSSELHASSPAAPPSSLAWGITSAGRAAVTATLVSRGRGSLWRRTPNTRVTAVHSRLSAVVILLLQILRLLCLETTLPAAHRHHCGIGAPIAAAGVRRPAPPEHYLCPRADNAPSHDKALR